MIAKAPIRNATASAVSRSVACGNGLYGCGKLCRILKIDPVHKGVTAAEGYHAGIHLCLGCANSAGYNWKIAFDDLDFLMTALVTARAGKCGVPATKDEVWAILAKMGVKPIRSGLQGVNTNVNAGSIQ